MTETVLRRAVAAPTVGAVLTAACTSSASTTTISPTSAGPSGSATTVTPAPGATDPPEDPRLLEKVTTDPDVTIGLLANGLTYDVRSNSRPGGRARQATIAQSDVENERGPVTANRYVEATTTEDIRRLAAVAFPQDRYVLVGRVPG